MNAALSRVSQHRALVAYTIQNLTTFDSLKTYVFLYVSITYLRRAFNHIRARGIRGTVRESWIGLTRNVMLLMMRFPTLRKRVDMEMEKARKDIEQKLVPQGPQVIRHLALPLEGQTSEWIEQEMERMDVETGGMNGNTHWQTGKISGTVYHGGKDLEASALISSIILSAYKKYMVTNPLHPGTFPTIRKMEAEIISMCLRMYNNPTGAGSTTSGGTESIIMSCKTHRDWARAVKGITEPEMVIPASAHAAFDKGGAYLGIKVHHIPVDPITRKVDVRRVARAINSNTIMLVGSAVNYPDGNADDIEALAALAKRNRIGMHGNFDALRMVFGSVDCCLGSFIVPFLDQAGFSIPPFDFRVDGVTAITCDTHKYGFGPKGLSVVMYRDKELRRYQYFVYPDWSGGAYASPTMAGSRPGATIAGTWATMQYMGQSGYLNSCRSIVTCAKTIEAAIRETIPELYVLGEPAASVVAFGSQNSTVNVLEVGDIMAAKGWDLNGLANPPAVHIACTRLTTKMTEQFIQDLKESVQEAKGKPPGKGTMVTLYGLGVSSPIGSTLVGRLATYFIDALTIA